MTDTKVFDFRKRLQKTLILSAVTQFIGCIIFILASVVAHSWWIAGMGFAFQIGCLLSVDCADKLRKFNVTKAITKKEAPKDNG